MTDVLTFDLLWGIIRYGLCIGGGALLWEITQGEERRQDAFEQGFTVGQVYADPDVRPRRANV